MQGVGSEECFSRSVLLPVEMCMEMGVTAVAFSFSHPPAGLGYEVCFLDVEMSLWQMLQYPERKKLFEPIGGFHGVWKEGR